MGSLAQRTPITSTAEEQAALQKIEQALQCAQPVHFLGPQGETLDIPMSLLQALRVVVADLQQGDAVSIMTLPQALTTQEAAEMLNVSRPYLIKILEEGAMPYTKVGTHRRIRLSDVLAYKAVRHIREREGLAELTRLSQEFGLYDE